MKARSIVEICRSKPARPAMLKKIGIYCVDADGGGGAERKSLALAQALGRNFDVTLILSRITNKLELERYYGLDLARVRLHTINIPFQRTAWRIAHSRTGSCLRLARVDSLLAALRKDLDPTYFDRIRELDLDLFINNTFASNIRNPAPRGIYMCMFPHPMKGQPRPFYGLAHWLYHSAIGRISHLTPEVLDSYDAVTANSAFTAEWIRRIWNRPATVVYSAAADMGPPGPKRNSILHVGRFSSESRTDYKHQRTLLEIFRGMPELHAAKWELHFAGTVMQESSSRRMLARLQSEARGLPVHFHLNSNFEALRSLYRSARIYWHATGYATSAEQRPQAQEHFGLTTCEAMSAGAVPVVIDSGGQAETVIHGVNGFRWSSLVELRDYTVLLAGDPSMWDRFSRQSVDDSRNFSSEAFAGRVERIVMPLLALAAPNSGH